jgi:pimeloyl-ACP methyl ester carboxylesterase
MLELEVNGVRTVVRQAGPGDHEAVVFLHGNPGSSEDWAALLDVVAGGGRRAVAWDAPGFGRAEKNGFPQTVPAHAAFVGAALDTLDIERAHLVLHDFGGPWGLEWAVTEPERVASVVLIGTGLLLDYRWHALARIWRTPGLGEAFMATTTRPGWRLLLRRGNPRGLPRAFVDRMFDDFDAATRRAVLGLYRSVEDVAGSAQRLAPALRGHDIPALVLWGGRDPYLPPSLAERQREAFPRARCVVLPESGHWPYVDDPDRVAGELAVHLTRAAQPSAC